MKKSSIFIILLHNPTNNANVANAGVTHIVSHTYLCRQWRYLESSDGDYEDNADYYDADV